MVTGAQLTPRHTTEADLSYCLHVPTVHGAAGYPYWACVFPFPLPLARLPCRHPIAARTHRPIALQYFSSPLRPTYARTISWLEKLRFRSHSRGTGRLRATDTVYYIVSKSGAHVGIVCFPSAVGIVRLFCSASAQRYAYVGLSNSNQGQIEDKRSLVVTRLSLSHTRCGLIPRCRNFLRIDTGWAEMKSYSPVDSSVVSD